jgi:HAD superfamily hydrolase (TIGR01509 family)
VPYEAILFDFDGVLVDSEPVHFECWQEILQSFDMHLDWQTYRTYGIGVSDRDLMALICQRAGRPLEVDRLLAEYPRKRVMFRDRMLERQAFPTAVLELLPQLHAYQLAVVTSSGQSEVEPILRDARIYDFFRTVVYGGDVKKLKPAPDPYLLAIKRLGVRTALVVEDSDAGEASARAAGLDVLRVQSPAEMPELLRERIELSPRRRAGLH